MSPSPSPVPLAARLAKLPPYLFAEIDKNKREARARGVDLIDMGIGDPDLPTPPHIIEAIKRSAETPANHRYPDYEGLLSFRTAVADWYRKRFGVTLDPADRGAHPHRVEGRHRAHAARLREPGRRGPGAGSGLSGLRGGHVVRGRRGALHAAQAGQRLPARSRRDPRRRGQARQAHVPQLPEQPDRGGGDQGILRASRRVRAAAPAHRLPRRDVLGAALRRPPSALVPGDAGGDGGRGRVPLAVQDLLHDRLAHRLLLRQRGRDRRASGRSRPTWTRACSRRCRRRASPR